MFDFEGLCQKGGTKTNMKTVVTFQIRIGIDPKQIDHRRHKELREGGIRRGTVERNTGLPCDGQC